MINIALKIKEVNYAFFITCKVYFLFLLILIFYFVSNSFVLPQKTPLSLFYHYKQEQI